jgi:hypothetical protein
MTEEEFNQKKRSTTEKYKYIASCGHKHEVWLHVFCNRNTGVKCPDCVIKDNTEKAKQVLKVGSNPFIELEHHSIMYLQDLVKKNYDLKITFDGCLADVAIKPKIIKEDSWMMIQVKSTYKPTRGYNFKCKEYKDCIIFCLCDNDKKMWIFDGNNITVKDKIAIGLNKSKYDDNEVTKDDILSTLDNYYKTMKKFPFEHIDTPISDNHKVEKEYRKHRELKISFLEFEYPKFQGSVYDFMINNYKIQEKTNLCSKDKETVSFVLHKNNGKNKYTSYKKGDNDFYWLNLPDKKHFYVIPEQVLVDQKYIDTIKKTILPINLNTKSWISPYKFDYDNLDEGKLKAVFSKHKKED